MKWSLISNPQSSDSLKPTVKEKEWGSIDDWRASPFWWGGEELAHIFFFQGTIIFVESIIAQTLGLARKFSSPHQGVHFSHFCFWLFTTTLQTCLRSFPSQSLPHFHSTLYSLPSPSAYNYHLSILISFQADYIVTPTFMLLAPYILIS